jgi:hypothetical protein
MKVSSVNSLSAILEPELGVAVGALEAAAVEVDEATALFSTAVEVEAAAGALVAVGVEAADEADPELFEEPDPELAPLKRAGPGI